MEEEYEVLIQRGAKSQKVNPISISKINGVKWDNTSGGYTTRETGYSLYGYIDYADAMELVDCSGTHEKYYNDAKIQIPASLNRKGKYRKGYDILLEKAGPKPPSIHSRTKNGIPCTKQILKFLEEEESQSMPRCELREKIKEYGYAVTLFQNAIYRLKLQRKIDCPGDGHNPFQIISLHKTKN